MKGTKARDADCHRSLSILSILGIDGRKENKDIDGEDGEDKEDRGLASILLFPGAGRQLSRTAARQQIGTRALARQLGSLWYDHRRADSFRDEAPGAYKDIHAVMRAQRELVRIERVLRPVLGYR